MRNPPRRSAIAIVLVIALGILQSPSRAQAAPAPPANVETYTASYAARLVGRGYQTIFGRPADARASAYWTWRVMRTPSARWFTEALMGSAEYRTRLGATDQTEFVARAYQNTKGRAPTPDESRWWLAALANGTADRAELLSWLLERGYPTRLDPPSRPVTGCARFTRPGPVPLCIAGSPGHQRNVDILQVPGTNIYVNKVWFASVAAFVEAASARGYTLLAEGTNDLPDWMFAPGSWRSYDEQLYLYTHGYPANPPGKSMHEWGLAVDLECNGHDITKTTWCWKWAVENGPSFGLRVFRTVDAITDSEAWHFSTNGY